MDECAASDIPHSSSTADDHKAFHIPKDKEGSAQKDDFAKVHCYRDDFQVFESCLRFLEEEEFHIRVLFSSTYLPG